MNDRLFEGVGPFTNPYIKSGLCNIESRNNIIFEDVDHCSLVNDMRKFPRHIFNRLVYNTTIHCTTILDIQLKIKVLGLDRHSGLGMGGERLGRELDWIVVEKCISYNMILLGAVIQICIDERLRF